MSDLSESNHAYWQGHVDQCQQAGMSKAAYCRTHDLNYSKFLYWHQKLSSTSNQLIPVRLHNNKGNDAVLCAVDLENGRRITIYDASLLPILKNMIQVLS